MNRLPFRFNDKVEALLAADLDEQRPIGIVGSERRRHFEPGGQLRVDFDRLILFKLFRKAPFNAGGIIHNMLEDRLRRVFQHVLQIAHQLFLLEKLLCVILIVSYPLVFDAVDKGQPFGSVDDLTRDFDESLWVALEVFQADRIP